MAISRKREYLADAGGAEISGDAEGLALALRKLLDDPREIRDASRSTAHLYIEGPLSERERPTRAPRRHVQHAPAARGPHREARGDRRLQAAARRRGGIGHGLKRETS